MNYLKHKRENVFFSPIKHCIKVFFFFLNFWRINFFFCKTYKKRSKIIIILIVLKWSKCEEKKKSFIRSQRQRVD